MTGCLDYARLLQEIDGLENAYDLWLQARRRERGAYTHPELAPEVAKLETALKKTLTALAHQILESLRGASDDIASGRLHQKKTEPVTDAEIDAALSAYEIPHSEKDHGIDPTRLAAILALIGLWKRRYQATIALTLTEMFRQGEAKALAAVGQKATTAAAPAALSRLTARYNGDVDRLAEALQNGSPRAEGVEWIVQHSLTVGVAAVYLQRLFASEEYRAEMLAESLVWRAFHEGERVGAIAGTRARLKALGATYTEGMKTSDLDAAVREQLPRYRWTGPLDKRTCAPCESMFGEPVIALSEADLPSPADICAGGIACRHSFELEL